MAKAFFTNGASVKNIDFSSYPNEAWTFYSNPPSGGDGQALYQSVAFVFRCAQLLSGAIQSMPWAIVQESTGEDYDTSDDYKNRIGFMPDPSKLFAQVELSLFVWGMGYLFRERNTRVTKNLRYIVPTTVQPQIDPIKGLTGFKRDFGAGTISLTADDLVYFWEFDPWVELGPPGASRFKACMAAAGLLDALVKHEAEFVRRGGVLPTMLLVKGMPNPAERERLESYWDRFIKGAFKVAGKIFNAESMDVKAVGEGLEALKDANFTDIQRQDIATAAGVPLSMLMANSSNYATALAEQRWFWMTTVLPECNFISSVMNTQVFNPLGLRLEWRYEQTDAFQEEEKERALSYATYIQSGMAPSMAAQVVGIELPPGREYSELDELWNAQRKQVEPQPEAQQETTDIVAEEMAEERAEARAELLSLDAIRDLEIWRRKALKKTQSGELPVFQFTTSAIPGPMVTTITTRLQSARTADDVRAAFDIAAPVKVAKATDAETILEAIRLGVEALKGGPGSGNWGHSGRPGERGGSSSGGGFDKIGVDRSADRGERLNALSDYAEGRQADKEGRTREPAPERTQGMNAVEKSLPPGDGKPMSGSGDTLAEYRQKVSASYDKLSRQLPDAADKVKERGGNKLDFQTMAEGTLQKYIAADAPWQGRNWMIQDGGRTAIVNISKENMNKLVRTMGDEAGKIWDDKFSKKSLDETDELKAADSYIPPQAVRDAARRGLELREKYGRGGLSTQEAGEQGIGSGVARASTLANGDNVSLETLRRMRAFFSRHEKNKEGGEDDNGYIAWLLWGGDPGRAWVERVLSEIEAESE